MDVKKKVCRQMTEEIQSHKRWKRLYPHWPPHHGPVHLWLTAPTPHPLWLWLRLSLCYCWTIILVQTVKCIILYNFIEEKITCRRSLCLDHDCTCKNELICKLCFTALYSWMGLSLPLPGDGRRNGAKAFCLSLIFGFPTFVCSLIHLFCFDSPLVYIIGF